MKLFFSNQFFRKVIFIALLSILSVIFYNTLSYRAPVFEVGTYAAYTNSLLQDGDFNLVNNLDEKFSWLVSSTYNMPDMHDHGVAILWAPFFLIGKWMNSISFPNGINSVRGPEPLWMFACFVASVFFFILSIRLLIDVLAERLEGRFSKLLFLLYPLLTPLFFYTFIEFTSAETVSFFCASLILFFGTQYGFRRKQDFFLWGLLFSVCRIVKISFFFWFPYFLYVLLIKTSGKSFKEKLTSIALFLGGLIPLLALKDINNRIQFGLSSFTTGYDFDFYFKMQKWTDLAARSLWGPFGILNIAPWLVLALACFVFVAYKNKKDNMTFWFLLVLASIPLMKWIYGFFSVDDSENTYGFRRFSNDVPICLVFIVYFWNEIKNSEKLKIAFLTLFSLIALWSIYYFFWYTEIDKNYMSAFGVYSWFQSHPIAILSHFTFDLPAFSSCLVMFLIFFCFFSLTNPFFSKKFNKYIPQVVILAFSFLYFGATFANLSFNEKNISQMKSEGRFERTVVATGFSAYLYDEVISCVAPNILIAKYKKNRELFELSKQQLESYFPEVLKEISLDPIGFSDDLKSGKIRPTYFSDFIETSTLLDFEAPTYYNSAWDK